MEKEGLQRVLTFMKQQGLTVEMLIMDRHRQINKWLRETHPNITHYYDVWHVAKGTCTVHTTMIKGIMLFILSQECVKS